MDILSNPAEALRADPHAGVLWGPGVKHPGYRLDGGQDSFAHWRRKFNGREVVFRVKVVFARLINDAKLSVFGCVRIRKSLVDFSQIQGNLVALVLQANYKYFVG